MDSSWYTSFLSFVIPALVDFSNTLCFNIVHSSVGSIERITQSMWILQGEQIVEKEITYTPGLYKIYDEILVNAADNKQRDPNMDSLQIEIDSNQNLISVLNNGAGIPIEMHKEHNCYVPTLLFGHLLTGSNFDDDEKKTTGGRNGYGAKLANIFSTEFTIECADANNGLLFKQTFRDNMKTTGEPKIKNLTEAQKKKGDFVKISFKPDLTRFKMDCLDEDTVALLSKRAYDIAGSMASRPGKRLVVSLNGTKLPIKKFENYLSMYQGIEVPSAYEKVNDRWEVGISISDGTFNQVSFVNAINTSKGGEHVNYIASQVANRLSEVLGKKKGNAKVDVKPAQIKNYLCVFVNALIDNPAFDSQTKENLITKKSNFGSTCKLSDAFLKKVEKSGILDKILAFAKFKERQALNKKGGKKVIKLTGIPKLDDANFAGSAKSKDCTLILTEGDSAKSLAMSGISVVGRDYYGVFPLKGKPLNVREATQAQVIKNDEIKNVVDIMGLKFGTVYDEDNIKTLRYGHLMIMADQDHDGSHIKGLIINFIHHFWPSLLNVPGFLQQFITPIVKATKGKQSKTFFTLPEYNSWKESTGNDAKGWNIKYYKGLGTSTSAEAKDYFSNLDLHEVTFCELDLDVCRIAPLYANDENLEFAEPIPERTVSGSDLIEMAFSKKHVEQRKTWLLNMEKDTYLDYSAAQDGGMKYSDFINKELILFSQADNLRSIPHVFDGFKPSQRKVLFGCLLKNLKNELKVAQLCGYIGEKSAYHHGEASLQGTIINMAQDFVGANNINLLTPSGQFGTRRMGGKDSASPRYIFTKLEKITRTIFHPDDDAILTYLHEDGDSIEPEYYMPVLPLLLVNGSSGIGTGWSTDIPTFNPRDIIANIRRKIKGEEMERMHPFFYGFTGDVIENPRKPGSYEIVGKIERTEDETLVITELPVKTWTQDYKVFLEKMTIAEKKEDEIEISDFKENHTDNTVSFTITAPKDKIDSWEKAPGGLLSKFKLTAKLSTTNMTVFNETGRIIKFTSAEKILDYFYDERLKFYNMRKAYLLTNLRREERILSNKARFVEEVCSGDLIVSNRKRAELLSDLEERGYELFPKQNTKLNPENESTESDQEELDDDDLAKGYEYLLGMKIWSLTYEKAAKLRQELADKIQTVTELEATPPTAIWEKDLNAIEEALDERDHYYSEAAKDALKKQSKSKKRSKPAPKKSRAKKVDSDDDDDDEDFVITKKPVAKKAVTKASVAPKPVSKPASVPAILKAPTVELDSDEDSDEDVGGLSLMERMRQKKEGTSAKPVVASKPKASEKLPKPVKRPSPRVAEKIAEELDSFDATSFKAASLTPAPKKSRFVNKTSSLDFDSDEEESSDKVEKSNTKDKTTKIKSKVQKKLVKSDSEDDVFDDDESVDQESDDEMDFVPKPRAQRTARAAAKRVVYDVDDDSDSEFDFDE